MAYVLKCIQKVPYLLTPKQKYGSLDEIIETEWGITSDCVFNEIHKRWDL